MNDFMISRIRTGVPIVVGALIAWLATLGLDIDPNTQSALVVALTGVLQIIYYELARRIEIKWPHLGWILGKSAEVHYIEVDKT